MPISIDNNYMNSDHSRIGYNSGSSESVRDNGGVTYSRGNMGPAPGSTVTGEIVEKDGDQVTIRLSNDQTISAKLQGNADIQVGMKMTFEVAKGSDNRISLRPLYSNLTHNNAATSALRAAGLPVNATTLAMTDKMMSESMPVNRNALIDMFKNVSTHSGVSPESIVQMTKLNMPLTDSNVVQFDNYRNFEHQITSDLQNVSDGVADLFREAVVSGESITGDVSQAFGNLSAAEVINEVLDLIDTDNLGTIMPEKAETAVVEGSVTDATAQTQASTGETITAGENGTPVIDTATTAVTGETANAQTIEGGTIPAGEGISTVISETPVNGIPVSETPVGENNVTAVIENGENVAASIKSTVDGFIPGLKEMFSPSTEDSANLIEANPNLSLTAKEQTALSSDLSQVLTLAGREPELSEPLDPAQILKTVRELIKEYDPTKAGDLKNIVSDNPQIAAKATITEKLSQLLSSEGFSKLIKDSVKAQMSIKPQDVAGEGKIEELYEKIRSTSQKITEMMQNIGRPDSVAAKSAAALNDNVNFMNQLNEFVNYVQLPLKMAGEDANGELYVYTKKKDLSENNGNFSALLHLDMEHLGPMDVYVTMRDYTKVNTNFFLQTEELLDFIESHIDELTKRLTDKGYDTSTKVSKRNPGDPIEPITDEFTKDEPNSSAPTVVAKMRFDVRA